MFFTTMNNSIDFLHYKDERKVQCYLGLLEKCIKLSNTNLELCKSKVEIILNYLK